MDGRTDEIIESYLDECSQILEINKENIPRIAKYLSSRLHDSGTVSDDADVFDVRVHAGQRPEKIRITGRHGGNTAMLLYEFVDKSGCGITSVNSIPKEQRHRLAELLSQI